MAAGPGSARRRLLPGVPASLARDRPRLARALTTNGLLVIFLLWAVYLSLVTDNFATRDNAILILRQSATIGIVAIGATVIVLLGEIDLSLGAVLAVCGVVAGKLLAESDTNVFLAACVAVVLGAGLGLVNGFNVTKLRINSFMATLGMLGILEGLAFTIADGKTLFGPGIDVLSGKLSTDVGPLPLPVILLFVLYAAAWVLLMRTTFGARVYAIGNNERASHLAGIRVDRVKIGAFALAGALAGFGALLQVARLNSAGGGMGIDLLFPIITAVVLGGASLAGGRGRIQDTLLASIFLATITNGLILLGVSGYAQRTVSGTVLIVALALNRFGRA